MPEPEGRVVDPKTLDKKVLCGYQGWFRCPGDQAGGGWVHWSKDGGRIAPDTLAFEMWPDVAELGPAERFPAPGFAGPEGELAHLFSSAHPETVARHFRWMRDHGIDGAMLQHFAVDLPGGPLEDRYTGRLRVLRHVEAAARASGRAWALAYDVAGMPGDRIFDVMTADWKRMVDDGTASGPNYLHERGRPVVQVWGFYRNSPGNAMTPELARRLIDFFRAEGRYGAYLIGGGDWDWRVDPAWREVVLRFDAYSPWNVGNYRRDAAGVAHASTDGWEADKRECDARGVRWLPVVYPGFGWDNLQGKPHGTTTIPRRGGEFYREQFRELHRLGVKGAYVAMFDEVDEGTAIFKVTSSPPTPGRFLTYEGLPSDWYLRLTGEGARLIRGDRNPGISNPDRTPEMLGIASGQEQRKPDLADLYFRRFEQPELARELCVRSQSDQAVRAELDDFRARHGLNGKDVPDGTAPEVATRYKAIIAKVQAEDRRNLIRLKEVVARHGWPGRSLVGPLASQNAWLLAQHADADLEFQRVCMEKMKALPRGEIDPKQLAYLTDRVLVGEGRKQSYGTQATFRDGKIVASPIEDEAGVDERRRSLGLEPMADYLRSLERAYRQGEKSEPVHLLAAPAILDPEDRVVAELEAGTGTAALAPL